MKKTLILPDNPCGYAKWSILLDAPFPECETEIRMGATDHHCIGAT